MATSVHLLLVAVVQDQDLDTATRALQARKAECHLVDRLAC